MLEREDRFRGFLVSREYKEYASDDGLLGTTELWLKGKKGICLVIAVGDPKDKKKLEAEIGTCAKEHLYATVVDAGARMDAQRCVVRDGCIISPGAQITTNVALGKHVYVGCNAVVSHDVTIGAYSSVSPGAAICGNVTIKEGCRIGAGAVVLPHTTIGPWARVGSGSIVRDDVGENQTVAGLMALPLGAAKVLKALATR